MLKRRSVVEQDRTMLEDFILQDSNHRLFSHPGFWMPPAEKDSRSRFVMEDSVGPCMFVRAESVLRLHIQFCPQKVRNARALAKFIPQIEADARKHGFVQIIWDSVSPDLIKFAERFGYRSSPNEIIKDL